MTIKIGNAPVSFGVFEPGFGETKQLPWPQVLDHIRDAGYGGTELGPYGYLPTDPKTLDAELKARGLSLGSSFVQLRFPLDGEGELEAATDEVLTVGRLLATQNVEEVIVADAGDAGRIARAGRNPPGWSDQQWQRAVAALHTLAERLFDELRMRIVIHHHAGTYWETPAEIERLLELTSAGEVDLLLDTGHYVYGGGDPVTFLEQFPDRVRYVHYKDVDAARLERVRREELDMHTAWRQDVFVPLGLGCVDFPALTERLEGYDGWIIVEQDVVPDDEGVMTPDPLACARASRQYLHGLGL